MDKKISIIVPVYNVEAFLDRCVQSIVNQTYTNLEIILIDDGSNDNSPVLCDEWAQKDERVRVVHKKNAGLGMARNSGLDIMTGDYVMFVDSDDYINLKACEISLREVLKNGADACIYPCINTCYGRNHKETDCENYSSVIYDNERVVDEFLVGSLAPSANKKFNSINAGISACMGLYSAKVIGDNAVRFYSERDYLNEDYLFRIDFCRYAGKIEIINVPLYYYYHHSGTLTTSYIDNHFEKAVKMYQKGREELLPFDSNELLLRNTRFFMTNILSCFKHEVVFEKNRFRMLGKLRRYCKNKTLQTALKGYPLSALPLTQRSFFYAIRLHSPLALFILIRLKFKLS